MEKLPVAGKSRSHRVRMSDPVSTIFRAKGPQISRSGRVEMKPGKAKRLICQEFRRWAETNAIGSPRVTDGFVFFGYLKQKRPDLLKFRCPGDKWQSVYGFLSEGGLVSG